MDKRRFLTGLAGLAALPFAARLLPQHPSGAAAGSGRWNKPDAEWRHILAPERYQVLRQESTEAPFSSPLDHETRVGLYVCAGCRQPLFESSMKYDSGTGWPSFYTVLPGRIATRQDFRLVMPRTEYHCARCGGHQGHIFNDGPQPTGLRYCNNGLALLFLPKT